MGCSLLKHQFRAVHDDGVDRLEAVVRLVGVLIILLLLVKAIVSVACLQITELLEMNKIVGELSLLGEGLVDGELS